MAVYGLQSARVLSFLGGLTLVGASQLAAAQMGPREKINTMIVKIDPLILPIFQPGNINAGMSYKSVTTLNGSTVTRCIYPQVVSKAPGSWAVAFTLQLTARGGVSQDFDLIQVPKPILAGTTSLNPPPVWCVTSNAKASAPDLYLQSSVSKQSVRVQFAPVPKVQGSQTE